MVKISTKPRSLGKWARNAQQTKTKERRDVEEKRKGK